MRRLIGTILFVLIPLVVWASEGAHHEVSIKMEIFRIINFVIFLWLLYKFTGNYIKKQFIDRKQNIASAIEEAQKSREEAKRHLEEARGKIANLEREISHILEQAEKEKNEQIARIREETQRMVARLKEQAKVATELEVKKAKQELQQEAIELAVNMAENLLKEKITPEDQKNLFADYVSKVKNIKEVH